MARCKRFLAIVSLVGVFAWAGNALADSYTYELNTTFSGDPDAGTVTVVIADLFSGGVQVTMSFSSPVSSEFVSEISLNFADIGTIALTPTYISGDQATSVTIGSDCCQADGDGKFDIQFNFATKAGSTFTSGDTSIYQFLGDGITAADFNIASATGGGEGTFCVAAHVQGTTGTAGSGWQGDDCSGAPVTDTRIPEPSALLLLGVGLIALRRYVKQLN